MHLQLISGSLLRWWGRSYIIVATGFGGHIYLVIPSHHFMTFSGKAHVGYIPNQTRGVVGLSKLARLVDGYAARPQLQERMTIQISNKLQEKMDPQGTMVVVEASHSCLSCRGAKKSHSTMTTIATTGVFAKDLALREEFFKGIK